jgi:nucleoside phosphorylase
MSLICYEFTIFIVTNMSLMCTIGTLNPRAHYVSGMGLDQLNALRNAFERIINLDTAVAVLSEAQTFYANASFFSSPITQKMTVGGKTSPAMHLF